MCEMRNRLFSNICAATTGLDSLAWRRLWNALAWVDDYKIKEMGSIITIDTVLAHVGMLDLREHQV